MSQHRQLKLYDFDSTLFDLQGFVQALPVAAQATFGIDAREFAHRIPDFYQQAPTGHPIGYDIEAHLAHHGADIRQPESSQKLVDAILAVHQEITGQPNLLFPEVEETLAAIAADPGTDAAILTVNVPSGFEFKRRLCGGLLDDISAVVVPGNKGEFLTTAWREGIIFNGVIYDAATVYDDSAAQIEAVPNRPEITRIQVVRPGQRYPPNQRGIPTVDSLLANPNLNQN